jgi:hypothetical protein
MKPALAILLALGALPAAADDVRVPANPAYRAECGSCHVPYPPQLLPAESWRALMARLDRHFGSDASLDAKAASEMGRYLDTHAGRRAAPAGPEPRITETRWFRKEHRNEIPAGKNPAGCGACHAGAERGLYDDD